MFHLYNLDIYTLDHRKEITFRNSSFIKPELLEQNNLFVEESSCLVHHVKVRISLRFEFPELVVVNFLLLSRLHRLMFLWVLDSTGAASHQLSLIFVEIFCNAWRF